MRKLKNNKERGKKSALGRKDQKTMIKLKNINEREKKPAL